MYVCTKCSYTGFPLGITVDRTTGFLWKIWKLWTLVVCTILTFGLLPLILLISKIIKKQSKNLCPKCKTPTMRLKEDKDTFSFFAEEPVGFKLKKWAIVCNEEEIEFVNLESEQKITLTKEQAKNSVSIDSTVCLKYKNKTYYFVLSKEDLSKIRLWMCGWLGENIPCNRWYCNNVVPISDNRILIPMLKNNKRLLCIACENKRAKLGWIFNIQPALRILSWPFLFVGGIGLANMLFLPFTSEGGREFTHLGGWFLGLLFAGGIFGVGLLLRKISE